MRCSILPGCAAPADSGHWCPASPAQVAGLGYTDPPCIAGDHYPNADGTACFYCGLPAEVVAPDELAAAWADLTDAAV